MAGIDMTQDKITSGRLPQANMLIHHVFHNILIVAFNTVSKVHFFVRVLPHAADCVEFLLHQSLSLIDDLQFCVTSRDMNELRRG